jgi:hypothetical protein
MFKRKETQADLEFFTVFDSKSKSYSEPFPAMNKDVVLRDFANAFKHPEASTKNKYFMNAEDYAIFKVGQYDLKLGALTGQNPEHVVNLHDIRAMSTTDSGPRALSST